MRFDNNKRLLNAFLGSFYVLGGGVYCLFLQMGTYNFVPLVIGVMMLAGANLMRDPAKERAGGLLELLGVVFLLATFNNMTHAMVSTFSLDIGEQLNFGIVDRMITTTLFVLGCTYGLIGSIDGVIEKDMFLKYLQQWHVPKITMLLNGSLTAFALLWVAFYVMIARHPVESLLFFPMAGGAMIGFFIGWWALNRRKCIGAVVIGNFACALLFGFLSLLDFIYLPLCMLNILSNETLIASTNSEFTFMPRWKPRDRTFEIASICLAISALIIAPLPFFIGKWPATQITVTSGNEAPMMEIHWAYGSEQTADWDWIVRPEIVDMIKTINGNSSNLGINISVVIPLVRDVFNSTVAGYLNQLYAEGIIFDIMPIVDSSQYGLSDEYIYDGDIDRFGRIYNEMREWMNASGVIHYHGNGPNEWQKYRGLIVDLERTQQISGSISSLVMNYMGGPDPHVLGSNALSDLLNRFRSNNETYVAGAFFDFHIFDFVDMDDAQQEFFKISIVPPFNWDYIAGMIYQTGPGSNLSVLAYCNDMNYHFGDHGVPYAVTTDSDYEDILARLRIMKNTGFDHVGAWAMHELFFNGTNFGVDRPHRAANGSADPWTPERFIQLHQDLANDTDVTFTFDEFQSTNTYMELTLLLDIWLVRRAIYTSWPIIGERLPNPQFTTYTILCVVAFILIGFLIFYIAWDPYHKKPRQKNKPMDPTTGALPGKTGDGKAQS